ncbi:GNAT family N-acetyltransferase [Micromonospora parathelypteridis]|uniref:Transcriptional regulator with XRE-family HTH domain n=1 Tax=Micromonospora parathelypteridis TaxID=1839617 RepID=A0A840W3B1_9ACTN|nr:GNAT family N-acetyltransferase [Micromonospora parathelypteridis]MBB5478749.1 transcriptional regulator with XRE-family HTH domain [Micromonospora parathelypteridis]
MRSTWGQPLRDLRRRADLSQRELAERSGVPKSTLARIEAAQGAGPAFRTVERLVRAAGGEIVLKLPNAHSSAAVDESPQAPDNELRDEAGRRYPAHLDVRRVLTLKDWPAAWWVHSYTLPQRLWPVRVPELTYDLDRARRDERRLRDRTRAQVRFRRAFDGLPATSWRFLAEVPGAGPVGELRAHERSLDLLLGEDWGDRRELVLESIVVAPGLRTLGLGRQLIELLAREMAVADIRTIHAIADGGNVEFLLACGFELQAGRPSALTLEVRPPRP